MKTRLNLFSHKRNKAIVEINIRRVRIITTIFGVILFCLFLFTNYLVINIRSQLLKSDKQKQDQLNFLIENKETNAQLQYFKTKENQITTYMKDDARFILYYKILNEALSEATDASSLQSVTIDNNRQTTFVIKLPDIAISMNFLRYIESDKFLNSFSKLFLTSFSLNQANSKETKTNYTFTFNGTFKEINVKDY